MPSEDIPHRDEGAAHERRHPGERIRSLRRRRRLSLRELARRSGLTPSHVSKIERGLTNPSVGALWKIADVLGTTVAQLFPTPGTDRGAAESGSSQGSGGGRPRGDAATNETEAQPFHTRSSPVIAAQDREIIEMAGVEFQRLTPLDDDSIEFIEVRHEIGAGDEEVYRHRGREYGVVLAGRLRVDVGSDTYLLEAGSSVAFDSSIPHRIVNVGDEPARAIWLTIDRTQADSEQSSPSA